MTHQSVIACQDILYGLYTYTKKFGCTFILQSSSKRTYYAGTVAYNCCQNVLLFQSQSPHCNHTDKFPNVEWWNGAYSICPLILSMLLPARAVEQQTWRSCPASWKPFLSSDTSAWTWPTATRNTLWSSWKKFMRSFQTIPLW